MKKTLLSLSGALALAALAPTESAAQFTVWKDGVSVYALEDGRADYVTFDYTPVGSVADANPDPTVGGAVPDESAAVDLGLTSAGLGGAVERRRHQARRMPAPTSPGARRPPRRATTGTPTSI